MKIEIFLYIGGIFHLIWAVFDLFWPQFFNWKETLAPLDDFHRILLPLISRMTVVWLLGLAYISFFHTSDLLNTDLGTTFLILVSTYWAARALLQAHYFGFNRANEFNVGLSSFVPFLNLSSRTWSYILFCEFWLICALYLIPLVYKTVSAS